MRKFSPELIKQTQDIWQPRLGYRPTEGEAEEMIRNVAALFRLLMEWESIVQVDILDQRPFKFESS